MAYCVLADLYNQISMADLIALSDDTGVAVVPNATVTSRAITDADAEIDAYLYGKYSTPLDPVPEIIKKLSIDLAIYNLSGRRGLGVSEERKERYRDGIRLLRDIQKGVASLGASTPAASSTGGPVSNLSADDRIITMDIMTNY